MKPKAKILDATCGGRMMWFEKDREDVIYFDQRQIKYEWDSGHHLIVAPDVMGDFRALPFDDESFHLVVFDPPHLSKLGGSSWLAKKYGILLPTWESYIAGGIEECMRVLKPNGTLIFKWSQAQIAVGKVLKYVPFDPLFGHTTGKSGNTIWITFMKSAREEGEK